MKSPRVRQRSRARVRAELAEISRALERELALAPREQLELELETPLSGRRTSCPDCGRWNYHLAACPRAGGNGMA